MKVPLYTTFDIDPMVSVKEPRAGTTTIMYQNYLKYQEELRDIAKAKRFTLSDNFKIIFILPISDKLSPMDQMKLIGEPHLTGKNQLTRLVRAFTTAFRNEDSNTSDVFRFDASKYWGERGKILVKNVIVPDYDYLRQIK